MENSNENLAKEYMRKYWRNSSKKYYENHKEKCNLRNCYNQYIRKYGEIPLEKAYKFRDFINESEKSI